MKKTLVALTAFFICTGAFFYAQEANSLSQGDLIPPPDSSYLSAQPASQDDINPAPVSFTAEALNYNSDAHPVSSILKDLHFSGSLYLSQRVGSQDEYLTVSDNAGSMIRRSELNWDQYLSFLCAEAGLKWKNLRFETNQKIALPILCGKVYDKDWKNCLNSNPEIAAIQTNLSIHPVYTNFCWNADYRLSYDFRVTDYTSAFTYAAFKYTWNSFSAYGGQHWYGNEKTRPYGSYDAEDAVHFIYEDNMNVLNLERIILSAWIGSGLNLTILDNLKFSCWFGVCPFAYIQSLDYHPQASPPTYWLDLMYGFFSGVETGARLSYILNAKSQLFLNMDFWGSDYFEGNTYKSSSRYGDYGLMVGYGSGSAFRYLDFSVGYRLEY